MKRRSLVALALFGLLFASAASAQTIEKCQAGKKKCVGQATKRLLVCHAKAETKGDPVDQGCVDKVLAKFSSPSDDKGCIEKVEAKGGCAVVDNAAVLAAQFDAFVLDVVQNLDPGFPVAVQSKCSADKKKCVAKAAAKLLGCHAKADTKGELDPNCLIKRRQSFDGSLLVPPDADKGCFEKAEAKETAEALCLTHDDTAPLQGKIDAFVSDVLCVLTPAGNSQIDPQEFDACQPGCAGAHCVPTALLGNLPVPTTSCPAAGGAAGACVPDAIIAGGGQVVPATCTSIAGAEGRCLSTCLPEVAARGSTLPQGGCAIGERCMPCFDPTASDPNAPTGACSLGCDAPAQPPVVLSCPWSGPDVFNPSAFAACCGSVAHCVPTELVGSPSINLAACPGGSCVPDPILRTAGNLDPLNCVAFAGTPAPGRCLSSCLPDIAAQPSLEAPAVCGAGNKCAPCADPFTGADTGACGSLGCDDPAPTPAFEFPGCCTNFGVCVPKSQIADALEPDLEQQDCPNTVGSVYLCVDPAHVPGTTPVPCTAPFPFDWTSTCVPDCFLGDLAPFLPQANCPANWSCPPPS